MCPHIRALTWLLLIYYATWISLSEFHMISQDQATYFLIILHLHILYSRFNTYFSLHMPLPVWIQGSTCDYPFHFPCLRLPISHYMHILLQLPSVSVIRACLYPIIHSGVMVFRVTQTLVSLVVQIPPPSHTGIVFYGHIYRHIHLWFTIVDPG